MKLHAVQSDEKKISIDLLISDVFFDIKLNDEELIDKYIDEFEVDSYDTFYKQLFDLTEKYDFIHLYFAGAKKRKKALDIIREKENKLNDVLEEIKLIREGKKKDEDGKKIIVDKRILDEREHDIRQKLEQFWL